MRMGGKDGKMIKKGTFPSYSILFLGRGARGGEFYRLLREITLAIYIQGGKCKHIIKRDLQENERIVDERIHPVYKQRSPWYLY